MNASDILTEAADLLERNGWCRERLHAPTGEYCLVGALLTARGLASGLAYSEASERVAQVICPNEIGFPDLISWNDKQESAEPVIAALRAAAEGS